MKRAITEFKYIVSDGSAILTLESDRVKDGEILRVNTICVWHDNQATTEVTDFYITNGGTRIYLASEVPKLASHPAYLKGRIIVPEDWVIGGYVPAVANTEVIYLHLTGELYSRESYRKENLV